jgi:hypothetical protein
VNRVPRFLLIAVMATLALLSGPAAGALASGRDVLNDCTDDEVMQKTNTQAEYRAALSQLQGDTDQYGNCRDVIKRAQLKAAAAGAAKQTGSAKKTGTTAAPATSGDTTGGAGAIGSAPAAEQLSAATPTERAAVDQARTASKPFENATTRVDPTKVGTVPGVSQVSNLPTSLIVVLALLLVAALALAAVRIRSLVDARRA